MQFLRTRLAIEISQLCIEPQADEMGPPVHALPDRLLDRCPGLRD
jgi:hypothetical protein